MIAAGFQLDISQLLPWKNYFHPSENAFHLLSSRMQKT